MSGTKISYGSIATISLAHTINDMYANFLPQFLPFLIVATKLGYAKAAFLISVFTMTSSIVQPLLGYYIDKRGKGWLLYAGTLWMALFVGLIGLTTNYQLLVVLSALAGIGTAVFHPQASSLMAEISGERKGFMMSAFIATGNIGFALSPLLFMPMLQRFGLSSTVYLIIPGILVALMLFKFVKLPPKPDRKDTVQVHPLRALYRAGGEIGKIIIVILLRSASYTGLITLLPNYFKGEHLSIVTSGHLVFLMLFSGAMGGLSGGWLSDKFGRKPVIVFSLLASTVVYFGFFNTTGMISNILLALAGALMMASFPVTVVAAQEIIPESRALASGITMGFSIGLGGLAVTLFGWLADHHGLALAVQLLFILPAIAGLLALTLKGKQSQITKTTKPSIQG